MELREMVFFP
jgi:hypothetical protein